ncbi:AAA family ATPase [Acinetobacter sp. A47]|uniref:AAA family ATPase n=1 Tax=Acinetobacter sp. A47 TaxID=1561217 RepID=UPI000690D971|nr:AAA family ATPase [Acinetobacter sp. A47]
MIKVTLKQLEPILLRQLKAGIVPFLHGKPGIGKSALFMALAEKLELQYIDVRLADMDPTEFAGFPRINDEKGYAEYVPLNLFPTESWPLPKGKRGWLIGLDEFSSAPKAVQVAAYKLVLDRMVGQRKLHPNVLMVAAGNLSTDGAIVEPQSSAITSRTANFEVVESAPDWCEWANNAGIDHRITSFLRFKPDLIHTLNPDTPEEPYACARTWHKSSDCIVGQPVGEGDTALLASLIGEGVASVFIQYADIYKELPTLKQIRQDPKNYPVPKRLDIQWALMGSLCQQTTEDNLQDVIDYLDRFPDELVVVAMRDMFARQPHLYDLEESQNWLNTAAARVF